MRVGAGVALTALLFAGCAGTQTQRTARLEPLPAAPARPVQSSPLPPPAANPAAMGEVGPSAASVTRSTVVGSWRLAGGAGGCQLNLSLTSWKGGSRANTRGCANEDLARVSAWSYDGGTVVLKDNEGGTVARLSAQGDSAMSGATAGGASVVASR